VRHFQCDGLGLLFANKGTGLQGRGVWELMRIAECALGYPKVALRGRAVGCVRKMQRLLR